MRPLGVLGRAATLWRRPLAALALAAGLVAAPQAAADDLIVPEAPAAETIRASLGKAVPLRAAGGIQRVVVSQPEIAQVRLAGSDQLYVIGLEVGATNLLIYDTEGRLSQTLDVQVGYDAGALQESLDQLLPERSLTVTPLARGVLIEGEVTTPAEAEVVRALAERVAPEAVITQVHIQDQSVQVDVQIVETSSDRLREIGAALSIRNESIALATRDAPIGVEAAQLSALARGRAEGFDLRGSLRALEERGEARVLAQPIVVVASGETGSARAGGELPFPVPTDPDRVVVEFRPYGAGVKVKPTLQANGLVKLELEAELSEIDPQARVRLGDRPPVWWTPMLELRLWRGVSDEQYAPGVSGDLQTGGGGPCGLERPFSDRRRARAGSARDGAATMDDAVRGAGDGGGEAPHNASAAPVAV